MHTRKSVTSPPRRTPHLHNPAKKHASINIVCTEDVSVTNPIMRTSLRQSLPHNRWYTTSRQKEPDGAQANKIRLKLTLCARVGFRSGRVRTDRQTHRHIRVDIARPMYIGGGALQTQYTGFVRPPRRPDFWQLPLPSPAYPWRICQDDVKPLFGENWRSIY